MPNRKGWPDLMGLIQATADILQDAEILADDGHIASLTECRIAGIDKGESPSGNHCDAS